MKDVDSIINLTKVQAKGLIAFQELIQSSSGVAGLHLNGEIALWEDLLRGGRFECWLAEYSDAVDALTEHAKQEMNKVEL